MRSPLLPPTDEDEILSSLVARHLVMSPADTGRRSEPAEVATARRPRPRIETLADLIFGLSLAIDAIALLPTAAAATTPADMNSRIFIFAVVMAISIAPPFWQVSLFGLQARIYIWSLPLISYWLGRAISPQSRTYRFS